MTAKIISFDRAAARRKRSAPVISPANTAAEYLEGKPDGRCAESVLNDLSGDLSWYETVGFASAAGWWDAGRVDHDKAADREATRAVVVALDRLARYGHTERIARRYRTFLRTANRFAGAALRCAYCGTQQRVIQSIRRQTIKSLLSSAAVEEVCKAFARADADASARVLADVDRFAGARAGDCCAEWECSEARSIVCAMVAACGAHLPFEQLCHLRKLVAVLGLGLDA